MMTDPAVARLREWFKRIEWHGIYEHIYGCCPFCFQFEHEGHEDSCAIREFDTLMREISESPQLSYAGVAQDKSSGVGNPQDGRMVQREAQGTEPERLTRPGVASETVPPAPHSKAGELPQPQEQGLREPLVFWHCEQCGALLNSASGHHHNSLQRYAAYKVEDARSLPVSRPAEPLEHKK